MDSDNDKQDGRLTIFVFEVLRAAGCVMVVAEHLFLPPALVEYLHLQWCFSFGGLGIGIFTFVSGYLIARSLDAKSISDYAVSRFWRVWPTYCAVLLLAWTVFMATGYSRLSPTGEATAFGVLAQALFVRDLFNFYNPLVSADWTLLYEVQFYVVAGLAWFLFRWSGDARILVASYIAMTLVLYALLSLLSLKYLHGQAAMQRTGGSLFCFTGMLYYLRATGRLNKVAMPMLAVWALGAVCFSYFFGEFFYGYLQVSMTHLLAMAVCVACISRQSIFRRNALVSFVADISFPLYLLHQTFGTVGFSVIIGVSTGLSPVADRALTFGLLIIPLCVALHAWVETPAMKVGKRRRTIDPQNKPA